MITHNRLTLLGSKHLQMLHAVLTHLAKDYEIPKSRLRLDTIIGQGQFGDVHRGTYNSPVS